MIFLTLLALSIMGSLIEARNSPIRLPMTRRLKFSNGTIDILQHDEARVAAFRDYSTHGRRANVPIVNDDWGYTVAVGIGDSPITYNLIVDTGSANTWIAAGTRYVPTDTSVDLRLAVAKVYSTASFSGMLWEDTVTLANELTITAMAFGVASAWQGTTGDGILGIGPEGLTRGSLRDLPEYTIPTVTDFLLARDLISQPIVSMSFQPATTDTVDGVLTFGEPDPTMYFGNIEYTDITAIPRSSEYWGLDLMITYDNTEILTKTAGIVDCGATLLYIATDAYQRYQAATGATVSRANGLLQISPARYNALYNLNFHIGEKIYSLNPNAQIWPRSLNNKIRGVENDIYLVVADIGTRTGVGYDFLNGYVFLQRFYTVLDTGNSRIGFAETPFTGATTN
ncbi:aspartic proteinase [Suillus spraguei]|nr:aspartic proteinase [Suillus spraguei]